MVDSSAYDIFFVLYLLVPFAFFCEQLRRRFRSVRQCFIAQPVQGARHVAARGTPSLWILITGQIIITALMLFAFIEDCWTFCLSIRGGPLRPYYSPDLVTIIYGSLSLVLSSYQLIILFLTQFPSSISALQISPQELAPMLWARHTMILVINLVVVLYFGIVIGGFEECALSISYFVFLSATIAVLFLFYFLRLYIQRLPAPPPPAASPAASPPSANTFQPGDQEYPLAMVVAANAAAVSPQAVPAEYASLPAHAVQMHYVGNGVPAYPIHQSNQALQGTVANPEPATEATEGQQPSNATDVPQRLVFCHNCGQQASHGAARYCSHCGTLLSKEPPPRSN